MELRAEWGVQSGPVAQVVRTLGAGTPVTTEALIAATALSHRSVTDVLGRLEPWLESGPHGHRLREPAEPWGTTLRGRTKEVERRLTELTAAAPRRRKQLDHVAATLDTRWRRARFLAGHYDLDGATVLCLGDHDLTSLALALIAPKCRIAVVDVDDELLEHVDRSAAQLGAAVACRFADLRLGLPADLAGAADLVFTDPPYTPEGVRLFAARGCEALRRDDRSRLLLCYGHGERQPALGLKVQAVLQSLQLLVEEVRPGFNRYRGAQAIGGASALYVTRPVAATWRAIERETLTSGERIYTHGPMAVEAGDRPLSEALARELPDPLPAAELWRLSGRHAAARPERRPKLPEVAAVDLSLAPALAPRLLLVHRGRRLRLALPGAAANALLADRLLGASYVLRVVARDGALAVVEAERRDDAVTGSELLARRVAEHPAASVASSLREALIAAGAARTKNEARALLAALPDLDARPADLPLHRLRELAEALPGLVSRQPLPPRGRGGPATDRRGGR
jgi:Branched-chain polyamine synthase A C-terminal domain